MKWRKNKKKLNIEKLIDFSTIKGCRQFLENIYIKGARVDSIELETGAKVKVEDIPEDQVIKRAKEIKEAIKGS